MGLVTARAVRDRERERESWGSLGSLFWFDRSTHPPFPCPQVRTLATYLSETNLNLYHWLIAVERAVPIPRDGSWDDVSGTTFLRTMLALPISDAAYDVGRDDMYNNFKGMQVDPRSMAQRIMEIRKAIAAEMRVRQ